MKKSNIIVEEIIRELSTIKVLGFFDQETTLYIYRETIILSIIGILCGYLAGIGLHTFIITSLPPDNARFDPALPLFSLNSGRDHCFSRLDHAQEDQVRQHAGCFKVR
ncbi:hypothetical protein G134_506 [Lactobacillus delbrueckii subsp. lactis CRL581]|nr:hypothetical protein G134_506 [Lactobacillus delbrueckii subsp. lactis CRL581]RZM13954.1 ABC transporter [Lactobacillus delbrueckii]